MYYADYTMYRWCHHTPNLMHNSVIRAQLENKQIKDTVFKIFHKTAGKIYLGSDLKLDD